MAAANKPSLQVHEWRPFRRAPLRGYFSINFPRGLIITGFRAHESDGHSWIGLPVHSAPGGRVLSPVLTFTSREQRRLFEEALLHALASVLQGKGNK